MQCLKVLLLLIVYIILLRVAFGSDTNTTKITLAWDIPKESLGSNASVQVYSSTNIAAPIKTWAIITNVPATTNVLQIQVTPGKAFYAATFSNFWGVSDFSNVAGTPAPVRGDEINLGVSR